MSSRATLPVTALALLGTLAIACSRSTTQDRSAAASGEAPAANAATAAAPEGPAHGAAQREQRFEGTYEAQPGTMYIPREGDVPNAAEWAGTKFRSDDAGVGRGTGTLTIVVAAEGTVHGEGAGSLGAFALTGQRLGDRLVATLRGSGPEAFVGTLDLHVHGGEATGEGRLSDGEARVVRAFTAKLTAK